MKNTSEYSNINILGIITFILICIWNIYNILMIYSNCYTINVLSLSYGFPCSLIV